MKQLTFVIALIGITSFFSCSPGDEQGSAGYEAGYITMLGSDTLAAEQFAVRGDSITATVMLRVPGTSLRQYILKSASGDFREMLVHELDPANGNTLTINAQTINWEGDSLIRTIKTDDGERISKVAGDSSVLPFIDMVHWPYELAFTRAYRNAGDSITQNLMSGRRVMPFIIHKVNAGQATIRHPFRGVMEVETDEEGHLVSLDAKATTRKLKVTRVPVIDVPALAARYHAQDQAGQSFGALSTRGFAIYTAESDTISIDYGRPSKRGRQIFGTLVPYGEVWRTGANRATHLTTTIPINVGGCELPAGNYTLYTIPESEAATLIINQQTGQGGTTYNQEQDLCRVTMSREVLEESIELFTIEISKEGDTGRIVLKWDTTGYFVEFR